MQTLSDLAKTIQNKTSERAQNTEQIVQDELTKLEHSLQQRLKESEHLITTCISDHQTNLQTRLNQALVFKNWLMITIGGLLAIILVMGLANLWVYKNLKDMRAEKNQIQTTLDRMPLTPKVLSQLNIQQDEKFYYIATKSKAVQVFTNQSGGQTIKIKK